jgi:hypothetical protein
MRDSKPLQAGFMRGIEVKAILRYEHDETEPPLELAELQTFN